MSSAGYATRTEKMRSTQFLTFRSEGKSREWGVID